jgi:CheY-like chemotaxis protein
VTIATVERAYAGTALEREWPTRVLIVDDAASTRRFLRGVLEYCPQFEVAGEADNGATAIELTEALRPDVVLLDLLMPVIDGANALGGLLAAAPDVRVIILSGMDSEQAAPLLAAGATAFVPKGLAPFELLQRLGDILNIPVTLERSTPTSSPPDEAASPAPPQTRAVICDDDPMARRLVTRVLENCDVSVVAETDTAPSLLSVIELAKPDLVVLDLWLEGISGTTALPEIRKLSPHSVILVYSSFDEWKENALAAGATAFVTKPNFEELGAAVHLLTRAATR